MVANGIEFKEADISAFCNKWKIQELSLFGSILRDDFRTDSDIDMLVVFAEDAKWSFFQLCEAEEEMKGKLGRDVELVPKAQLKWVIRDDVINSARLLYAL